MVIFVVQCCLCCPVHQGLGKKLCEDVVEPGDNCHVQGKTVTGHPAHHPGPFPCAEKCLSERVRGLGVNTGDILYILSVSLSCKHAKVMGHIKNIV